MKIGAVLDLAKRDELSPLQKRTLDYLNDHRDEVFGYRDEKLVQDLQAKPSAIGFTLWALHKKGLVDKQAVAGKVYFGSKEAIAELRGRMSIPTEDPFERADRNREAIKAEVGNLDNLSTLDEVRSGR